MPQYSDLLTFIVDNNDAFKSQGRLASLYSDFPAHREVNPDGYAANITAWQQALASAAQARKLPAHRTDKVSSRGITFRNSATTDPSTSDPAGNPFVVNTGEELISALETSKLGRPQALAHVISDASVKRDFVLLQDFLAATSSLASGPGLLSILSPWNLLSWGLSQTGLVDSSAPQKLSRQTYIVRQNLQNVAFDVIDHIHKHASTRVFTTQAFSQVLGLALPENTILSPLAIQLLLLHMSRDMQPPAAIFLPESKIVKFSAPHQGPQPITDADVRVAQLTSIIESTTASISSLEAKASRTLRDVKAALESQNRSTALTHLRKKKLIDGSLEKRREMLLQLESVLFDIEEAGIRAETVKQLDSSVAILKTLNLATGGPEAVERIMNALEEERETGAAINSVLNENVTVDESQIETELAELEAMEGTKKREAEQLERERLEAEELDRRLAESGIQLPLGIRTSNPNNAEPPAAGDDIQKMLDRLAIDGE